MGKTEVLSISMFSEFTFDGEDSRCRLYFGFSLIYFQKTFFPKFELLNSGCGLSVGVYGKCLKFKNRTQCLNLDHFI